MPIYCYKCHCGHAFEVLTLSTNNIKAETCKKCGGVATRSPGSSVLKFKGTGFYVNDYKNNIGVDKSTPKEEK